MNTILQRAALQYLRANARSATHAASAGGHGGTQWSIFEYIRNYVTK